MADKLRANRAGKLTDTQRAPVLAAALVSGLGFIIFALFALVSVWGFAQTISVTGVFGWVLMGFTVLSFSFLLIVLWTNAEMFVPEAFGRNPVRWTRGKLEVKMSSRERPEMPFTYLIGDYSFAPFLPPQEVPIEQGREYLVYYTARSRLLLSMVPTDIRGIKKYLPEKQ
jgi:hypothetical protein